YMAPEQANGQAGALSAATDVFGLGGILYHLLTGRAPHQGSTLDELRERVSRCQITPPRQFNPRVPAALERICLKALGPEPDKRYPSAATLSDDLRRYRQRPRRLALAAAALAGAAVLAVVSFLLVIRTRPNLTSPIVAPLTGELNVLIWAPDKRG